MAKKKTATEEVVRESTYDERITVTIDSDVVSQTRICTADLSWDADQRVSSNDYLGQELL